MFELNFKAKVLTATKNSKDNYYMIGLADDKYNYKNYIIFQRPIKLKKGDDENSDILLKSSNFLNSTAALWC